MDAVVIILLSFPVFNHCRESGRGATALPAYGSCAPALSPLLPSSHYVTRSPNYIPRTTEDFHAIWLAYSYSCRVHKSMMLSSPDYFCLAGIVGQSQTSVRVDICWPMVLKHVTFSLYIRYVVARWFWCCSGVESIWGLQKDGCGHRWSFFGLTSVFDE